MGLRIVSSEWVNEIENERDSYKAGLEKMQQEHEALLRQYRELRDSKDAEISRLHKNIEILKVDNMRAVQLLKQLRKAIKWYEDNKNGKAAV